MAKKKEVLNLEDIDRLGFLLAEASALSNEISAIKARIKASGVSSVDGNLFRVSVVEQVSSRVDSDKVKALLGKKYDLCLSPSVSVQVRCVARKAA